jgi:hypothetical protein
VKTEFKQPSEPLPQMEAVLIEGVLYVKESDCRAVALASMRNARAFDMKNESLIRAAPELLAALEGFYDLAISDGNRCFFCKAAVYGSNDTDEHSPNCEQEIARVAIAKARNQTSESL